MQYFEELKKQRYGDYKDAHMGYCPASCGEIIQGNLTDGEFLTSYTINKFSTVLIKRDNLNIRPRCSQKTILAVENFFEDFGERNELKDISIYINSDIPRSKGMSSSTADIGAALGACMSYLNITLDSEDLTKRAAKIEPTDSIYYENLTYINPLTGNKIEDIGKLSDLDVIILEPDETVETSDMRKISSYEDYKSKNINTYKEIFKNLKDSIEKNDMKKMGETAIKSAFLNQKLLYKPHLEDIVEASLLSGAFGVNIAHSGSVLGILLNEYNNKNHLYNNLSKEIKEYYNKMYTVKIIKGGIGFGKL